MSVSLNNYLSTGSDGFGSGSTAEVDMLNKALEVGQLRGGDPNNVSGGMLKVESLESTLKILSYDEKDMQVFQMIPKLPAYSTAEEYLRLESYGAGVGGFVGEGALPEASDSVYSCQVEQVKYIGRTREISLQAQMVKMNVGNIVQREIKNGTLEVMRIADKAIVGGDANVVPLEYNGVYALQKKLFTSVNDYYNSEVVIDCRGSFLKEEHLEQSSDVILENNGVADLLVAPPAVLSSFVRQFYGKKLISPNTTQVNAGVMGQRVIAFESQFGQVGLSYDKFMKAPVAKTLASTPDSVKTPATPVANGIAPTALVTDTTANFGTLAGDYFYAVAAVNENGESALATLTATALTVGATQSVNLKFTAGVGAYAATGFVIYRSEADSVDGKLYPILRVSTTELGAGYDGGGNGLVRDRLRVIANTDSAFILENNDQVWSFKQLAPLMKMDLARTTQADRFMILMYATPQLYAPRKVVRFINIGKFVTV